MQYNLYRKERERKHTTVYILVNLVSHNFNKTSLSRIFNAANQHFIEIIRDPTTTKRRTYSALAIEARGKHLFFRSLHRSSTSIVHLYRRLFESQSTSIVD